MNEHSDQHDYGPSDDLKPRTIFKYEPLSLRSIQNLKAGSIYFGSPRDFNDPYDCALTAIITDPSSEEREGLREMLARDAELPDEVRAGLSALSADEISSSIRRATKRSIDEKAQAFLATRGVRCFSEKNDNLLMWAHYGGRHRGFCLEFRTSFTPFGRLRRVVYQEVMPSTSVSGIIKREQSTYLLDLFLTKAKDWAYECEWRILQEKPGPFAYEREALKAIYFGAEMSEQDRDLVMLILYSQNPQVEAYVGRRSTSEFRVEFERVTEYLPYAEAKRQGRL